MRQVRLHGDDWHSLRSVVAAGFDVIAFDRSLDALELLVDDVEIAALREAGFRVAVVEEDYLSRAPAALREENLGAYLSYDELNAAMVATAQEFPDLCRLSRVGRSVQDRYILGMKVSDNPEVSEDDELQILYLGCHHARELIAPEVPYHFMRHLLEEYGSDPVVDTIVEGRETFFIPMMNPDGHVMVEGGDWLQRKNANEVDLNRNWGYQWGYDDIGSSPNRRDETYRGPYPFSEPENRAVRDFCQGLRLSGCFSYHSYGDLYVYPWGYIDANTPHHHIFKRVGEDLGTTNGYLPGNPLSGVIYNTNGDSDDWMYGDTSKPRMISFTVEVGDEFWPPDHQIDRLVAENLQANLYLAYYAERLTPVLEHAPHPSTTDTLGPYPLTVDIDTLHYPGFVPERLDLVYRVDGGDSLTLPLFETGPGRFRADLPGQSAGAQICYHFAVRGEDGRGFRVPDEGSHCFTVWDRQVLLVDDDDGKGYEVYFADALEANQYAFETHSVALDGRPSIEQLAGYAALVWFTGDDQTTTLDQDDTETLIAYLDGGGAIFLTGQDIGYDIAWWSPFYESYLKADFRDDDSDRWRVLGRAGDLITDGLDLRIEEGDGSDHQWYPSWVEATGGAHGVFDYQGGKGAGLAWEGRYRLVYLPWGFEAIDNPSDRRLVMARVLKWLGMDSRLGALQVAVSTESRVVHHGEAARIGFTIANEGQNDWSGEWWTRAVPPEGGALDPVVAPTALTLAPGEEITHTLNHTVPGSLTPGPYHYYVQIGERSADRVDGYGKVRIDLE